jgi:hypothetical protein
MPMVTIGIDLAKNVFAIHGVDEAGKAVLVKPRVPRDQLATLIAQLPAMPDRYGGMLRRASLGSRVPAARAYGQAHGAQTCGAISHVGQARKERRGRCRCDLRSGDASEHAICAAEGRVSAGNTLPASDTTRFRRREDRDLQPVAGPAL